MTPSAMPVRSLTQSLLRWPEPERVGVFGSYGRGDAGVGSDLYLLLIDAEACGPGAAMPSCSLPPSTAN